MEISDIAATLDEGIGGWLLRHARDCDPPRPDAMATSTLVMSTRVAGEVTNVCELWHLSARVMSHAQPGWCVMQVSGPLSPVMALAEVTDTLRAFGARSAGLAGQA